MILLAPDPSADGQDGARGPYGAAVQEERVAARVSGAVRVDVVYPSDAEGEPATEAAPTPVLVMEQGGLVRTDRYWWLAAHLASRGYVTVLPSHFANLALFEVGNGIAALDALPMEAGAIAVGGHSLGGVVAVKEWLQDDTFTALVLMGSFPAQGDDVQARAGSPVLSMVGTDDGSAAPADVLAGLERFAEPSWYAEVEGLNHYGWTDDATAGELEKDGTAARPVNEARQDALRLLDTWLDATLRGDPAATAAIEAGDFPGVVLE